MLFQDVHGRYRPAQVVNWAVSECCQPGSTSQVLLRYEVVTADGIEFTGCLTLAHAYWNRKELLKKFPALVRHEKEDLTPEEAIKRDVVHSLKMSPDGNVCGERAYLPHHLKDIPNLIWGSYQSRDHFGNILSTETFDLGEQHV